MNKEKIVVILLLITIILSIGSLIVTFSLNIPERWPIQTGQVSTPSSNTGNVELVINKPNGGAT